MTEELEDNSASGYVPSPCPILIEDRTGEDLVSEVRPFERAFRPPLWAQHAWTPPPALPHTAIDECQGGSATTYRTLVIIDSVVWARAIYYSHDESSFIVVRQRRSTPKEGGLLGHNQGILSPAEELRNLSQLPPAQLADLFGVSRTTFYNWMEGSSPREEKFVHLVETLNHIKDARAKLAGIADLSVWLRMPVSPGAQTPLHYLKKQQFSVFRGLVVRARSPASGFSSVRAPVIRAELTEGERRRERERLSPSARFDDSEEEK